MKNRIWRRLCIVLLAVALPLAVLTQQDSSPVSKAKNPPARSQPKQKDQAKSIPDRAAPPKRKDSDSNEGSAGPKPEAKPDDTTKPPVGPEHKPDVKKAPPTGPEAKPGEQPPAGTATPDTPGAEGPVAPGMPAPGGKPVPGRPRPGGRQGRAGGDQNDQPWESFKFDKTKRIDLKFRNASPDMVLDVFSRASGITIVKDPSFTSPLTVTSGKTVTLSQAFRILALQLKMRGFQLRKEDEFLIVGPFQQEQPNPYKDMTPEQITALQNAGKPEIKVYPVEHANAAEVARIVTEVFGGQAKRQPDFTDFFFNPFGMPQPTPNLPVKVSSDDFTNSVIVQANPPDQLQVEALIKKLDTPSPSPVRSEVYRLKYAFAQDVAPVVQNVLVSNAPTGRGGQGNQQIPISQRFAAAARFGSLQSSFGQVVAEERTNTLIVSATEENHKIVREVIDAIDQPMTVEDTTVVVPLQNARADDMADLLNEAFGGGRGGFGGFGNFGRTGRSGRNNNRTGAGRNRNQFGGGGFGRGVDPANPSMSDLELNVVDPNADESPLATDVQAQFFGFGFGGGQNRRTSSSSARGADGRLVNIRDLDGQVQVISDTNTNSLIVVTDPENIDVVRSLIDKLDKIPEQVMIETIIVEASLDSSDKLGVEWNFNQRNVLGDSNARGTGVTDFGLQRGTTREGLRYSITGGDLGVFLNALSQDDKYEVLSTPRIFTSNLVEAEINISQEVPYIVSQREDASGRLTFNYDFKDVGIVLTVTPRITANGDVSLDITQTANDLQGFTDFNAPIINKRVAQTTVSVRDGETIILGGIIRSVVSTKVKKLPILGDIPILGQLFRSTDKSKQKTELLVFLTPRVVRRPGDAQEIRRMNEEKLSPGTQKGLRTILPEAGPIGAAKKKGS